MLLHYDNMGSSAYRLRSKHRRTLEAIFAEPVRANIDWKDVEKLLTALSVDITEGAGSRGRIGLNGVRTVFHRPHPERRYVKASRKI